MTVLLAPVRKPSCTLAVKKAARVGLEMNRIIAGAREYVELDQGIPGAVSSKAWVCSVTRICLQVEKRRLEPTRGCILHSTFFYSRYTATLQWNVKMQV